MKTQQNNENRKQNKEDKELPGYPLYPDNEDIYSKFKEEENLDPEDTSKVKPENEKRSKLNEKDFKHSKTGGDLDVPGSELDDDDEKIGSEDEENNYYSLGDTE